MKKSGASSQSTYVVVPIDRSFDFSNIVVISQKVCSLVVAAVRAAHEVLGSISGGSELFQTLTALFFQW